MIRISGGTHDSVNLRIVNHVDRVLEALNAVLLCNRQTECACRIRAGYNLAALQGVVDAFNVSAADTAGAYNANS